MQDKLYKEIRRYSLRYAFFMFYDTTPYLADQIFIRHKLKVWFEQEYVKDGFPYRAIICHVKKKDVPIFEACMKELKIIMIICGHPDYEQDIREQMNEIDYFIKMLRENENDTDGKTEQKETA